MTDLTDKLGSRFIVIDGPDGAGKTTQLKLLAEHLRTRGVEVCLVRDPGGTAIGDRIRRILLDNAHGEMGVECELMLYMASRAQLAAEVIRPALARGECVLCDRYISATVAYQGAGGAEPDTVLQAGRIAVGPTWPDLTILLDLDAEVGLARVAGQRRHDRMESRGAEFHRRVRKMFLRQAQEQPERFAVVDAAGTVEEVQQRLRKVVDRWQWQR